MGTRLRIKDNQTAVEIYYTLPYLGTADIRRLFGCCAGSALRLLKIAQEAEREKHTKLYSNHYALTDIAFEAWGLDIANITKKVARYRKLL